MSKRAVNSLCPPDMNPLAKGPAHAYLIELLQLSHSSLMGIGLGGLEVLLGAGTLVASEDYKVPADYDLVIFQISSYWRSTALATEPVLNANITSLDVAGMTEARLSNVLATLELTDRKLDVFENGAVPLNALYKTPMFFSREAPLIVPSNTTLTFGAAVQDATAAVVGNNAYYGILLTGALLPLSE